MDSITQAVLGGVVGELVLGRKIGGKGMAWGLLFGTMPDLDILFYPWLDQVEKLRWHRGVSHSILMMVLAALVFAKPLAWVHREKGVSARRAAWFVFLAWSTHVLIDVFTSYGTQVFEPFSDQRVAWSNLFIIDLFFTLPMLIWVIYRGVKGVIHLCRLCLWKFRGADIDERPMAREISLRGAGVAVAMSCLYVAFSLVMKLWAVQQIQQEMAGEVPDGSKLVAVTPTPFNTLLWRGLIESEDEYIVTYWSPFDDGPSKHTSFAKNRELAQPFEGEEMFEGLKWFARDHWVARKIPNGEVVFIDMRFGEVRDYEARQLVPMFRWHLSFEENGDLKAARPARSVKMDNALQGIWKRLWGERTEWESMKAF